jgi:WD40 repeat protein
VNVGFAKLQMASDLKFSDAVYGVAFSPDGTLLASGAADRAAEGAELRRCRLKKSARSWTPISSRI